MSKYIVVLVYLKIGLYIYKSSSDKRLLNWEKNILQQKLLFTLQIECESGIE